MNTVKKIKLNLIIISFLPIFIFIPIGFELLNNFHLGGIQIFNEFLSAIVNPKIDLEILEQKQLTELIKTKINEIN